MAAPLASIAGTTAAVAAVFVDAAAWAVPGAAIAGAPGLLHLLRRHRRERRRADRRARAMSRPVPPLVWEPVVWEPVVPEPVVWGDVLDIRDAKQDQREHEDDVTQVPLSAAPGVPDRRVDTGELQAMCDAGDGPDTGELLVVPDASVVLGGELVTEAPAGKQAVLVGGLTGTAHVLAPTVRRRSRRNTMEDRVFDALAMSTADPLTRTLELPSGSGRRAAGTPVEGSAQRTHRSLRAVPARRGRHVA